LQPLLHDVIVNNEIPPGPGRDAGKGNIADASAFEQALTESWTDVGSVLDAAVETSGPLGELLLQANRITRAQRDFSLAEQKKTGERLGELLVRLGWLSHAELNVLLSIQQHRGRADSPLRLGNILAAIGVISHQTLADALIQQQVMRKRLGEVLVELYNVSPSQVTNGLRLQQKLTAAALTTLLSLAGTTTPMVASAADRTNSVQVSATVLPSAQINVRHHRQLTITESDIRRGYIDVPAASQIEVKNNSRQGYALTFNTMANLFRTIQISGLGERFELGMDGGTVAQRGNAHQAVAAQLSYRFVLAENVQPGSYDWPIMLSVRPL
jgi:hypothetical protein